MKLIIRNSLLFFLSFSCILIVSIHGDKLLDLVNNLLDKNKGTITIVNVDAEKSFPLARTEFQIIDVDTNSVVDEIQTSSNGTNTTDLLPVEKKYKIVQKKVMNPYALNSESPIIELNEKSNRVVVENSVEEYITDYHRTDEEELKVNSVKLSVDTVLQNPELPNGCEVTSLAAVLGYYEYDVEKVELSERYMPKESFVSKEGKLYGADPHHAYAGDPKSRGQGFFSYPPPIINTANKFLQETNSTYQATDISGSSREEIFEYLKKGIPVITWTTTDMKEPRFNYSWYIFETNELMEVPINSHTVVVTGFDNQVVYTMDPLKGQKSYDMEEFFSIYEKAGSHAMVVN
ncbi:C39 family peptidase [Ornithinibacillus salinisoli]|uniref:C39 family peptidase n=1 Tax=Ornithinibacillus salinisoli TaxID=1848459 RepID=A0ABW4W3T6_9BACI